MQTLNVIRAIGQPALARFLDARAKGASQELLAKLSAEAMEEQETLRARAERRRPRLVVDNEKSTQTEPEAS